MELINKLKQSILIKLIEDSFELKVKHMKKHLFILILISFILSLLFIFLKNPYGYISNLFSSLSNTYSILIGFNISSVVFIVSYIFKERETLNKIGINNLNGYYKQIVNSFMLSTVINLTIIILGMIHMTLVYAFSIYIFPIIKNFILFKSIINSLYITIWIFLIISSIIIFSRCLITLILLLRINDGKNI